MRGVKKCGKVKAAALVIIIAFMVALFCSCADTEETEAAEEPIETPAVSDEEASGLREYPSLELLRHEEIVDNKSVMLCPAVGTSRYSYLSTLIAIRVRAKIRCYDYAVYTTFRIKCNMGGVLSMIIELYSVETDELLEKMPLTYDLALAREAKIQDYFREDDDTWRSALAKVVQNAAEARGMTLLSDIMPIKDDTLFYTTGTNLVIMYRPYEITTMTDPWPEFTVPLSSIEDWFKAGGGLERVLSTEENQAEEINGAYDDADPEQNAD